MSYLTKAAEINALCKTLSSCEIIAVDTETTGLDWKAERLVGMSLAGSSKEGSGYFFMLPAPKDRAALGKLLADPKIAKVFHNSKFDRHFLRKAGFEVKGTVYDTFPMAKLWNENRENHKLKSLAKELFDPTADESQDALKEWLAENKKTWADLESVPKPILSKYGAEDARICLGLFEALKVKLEEEKIPWELVELEMAVLDIAFEMEHKGVAIDKAFLDKYAKALTAQQAEQMEELIKLAGQEFNPESGAQVAEILRALGWKGTAATATGKDQVDKRALEDFKHPFTEKLLEHRRVGTIRSTFVEGILKRAVKEDEGWLVHASYNTAGARTGRWSSTDPNLQNVDKKSDARKGLVPRKGMELWLFDFKQIEPVIFAAVSESKRLQEAFTKGLDYHTFNAAQAFGVPMDQVTPAQRTKAKGLGLAIMYQAGAAKAAQMMGVPLDEGRAILAKFYANMPEIKEFQKTVNRMVEDRAKGRAERAGRMVKHGWNEIEYLGEMLPLKKVPKPAGGFWEFPDYSKVTEYGWVKNAFGRKRRLTISDNYKGLNALIQSNAGDLLKHAMVRIRVKTGLIPLLQVHDELGYELPKGKAALPLAKEIKETMESVGSFFPSVPIRVDVAVAKKNWAEELEVKL